MRPGIQTLLRREAPAAPGPTRQQFQPTGVPGLSALTIQMPEAETRDVAQLVKAGSPKLPLGGKLWGGRAGGRRTGSSRSSVTTKEVQDWTRIQRSCVKAKPKAWCSFSALDRDTACPRSHGKKKKRWRPVPEQRGTRYAVVRTLGERMRWGMTWCG